MKNIKLLAAGILAATALVSCAENSSLSDDLNSTGDSIVRFVNGTFSAQIDNSDVQSVYSATQLALNNSDIYNIKTDSANTQTGQITGTYATNKNSINGWFSDDTGKGNFKIDIVKGKDNIVNIYIKIGDVGDKQASVDLLSNIRTNLGL